MMLILQRGVLIAHELTIVHQVVRDGCIKWDLVSQVKTITDKVAFQKLFPQLKLDFLRRAGRIESYVKT